MRTGSRPTEPPRNIRQLFQFLLYVAGMLGTLVVVLLVGLFHERIPFAMLGTMPGFTGEYVRLVRSSEDGALIDLGQLGDEPWDFFVFTGTYGSGAGVNRAVGYHAIGDDAFRNGERTQTIVFFREGEAIRRNRLRGAALFMWGTRIPLLVSRDNAVFRVSRTIDPEFGAIPRTHLMWQTSLRALPSQESFAEFLRDRTRSTRMGDTFDLSGYAEGDWVPGTRFFACREELLPSTRRVTAPSPMARAAPPAQLRSNRVGIGC